MREAIACCFREGGPRFLSAVLGTGSPIPPLWFPVISQPQPTLMRKKTMKACDAYHMIEITNIIKENKCGIHRSTLLVIMHCKYHFRKLSGR